MKVLTRLIVVIATVAGVIGLILGGIFLGTGSLGFLENSGLMPNLGELQRAPSSDVTAPGTTRETGASTVLRFTWQGDEIVYNGNVISETEFATLLDSANANDAKVEIIKLSNVRVESADRRRQLLDDAGVRYEVIPQE
jgi:hypothetical protein